MLKKFIRMRFIRKSKATLWKIYNFAFAVHGPNPMFGNRNVRPELNFDHRAKVNAFNRGKRRCT